MWAKVEKLEEANERLRAENAALLGRAMEAAASLLRNKGESAAGAGDGGLPPAGYPGGPDGERDAAAFGGYPSGALSDEQWEAFTEGW